jgi:hypothetical protein
MGNTESTKKLEVKSGPREWFVFVILWNEFEVKGTTDSLKSSSSRDLDLGIDNRGRIKTKLYDKHDDITFAIVNFSFNSSSISTSPSYGVYISQLMRYSWACAQYIDFLDRYQLLTQKLLKQKFYRRHHNHRYGISWNLFILHLLKAPTQG